MALLQQRDSEERNEGERAGLVEPHIYAGSIMRILAHHHDAKTHVAVPERCSCVSTEKALCSARICYDCCCQVRLDLLGARSPGIL